MPRHQTIRLPLDFWPFIEDTREQRSLRLDPNPVIQSGLPTGDYTLLGYEGRVLFEWKSAGDLIGCVSVGRERFRRQCERMAAARQAWVSQGLPCAIMLVLEMDVPRLLSQPYAGMRSQVRSRAVWGTIRDWCAELQLPYVTANTHEAAGFFVRTEALCFARKYPLRREDASQTLLDWEARYLSMNTLMKEVAR